MSRARSVVVLSLAVAASCDPKPLAPQGQLRIGVDSDAILPPAPGDAAGPSHWLFDRLRIELFPPGETTACDGCTHEFGIDHRTVLEGRATFGFVPEVGVEGYRARVRIFRSVGGNTAEPRATSTLEAVVLLPATASEGIVDVHVELYTASLGAPSGTLDAPVAALAGPASGGLAGTFAQDYARECATAPRAGEVCVGGGAYWMGDLSLGDTYGTTSSERLVVVSPFFLDASEVTVGAYLAAGLASQGSVITHEANETCTFTTAAGGAALPVDCITRPGAIAYCATKGARLPTEAQWEYVAGARRSAHAVWGDDPARCGDAVFARELGADPSTPTGECVALGTGPASIGSGRIDRLALPGGTLVDVAGNLTEWMADAWAPLGTSCWRPGLSIDPICAASSPGATADYVVRGGSFAQPGPQLRAALRAPVSSKGGPLSSTIGFRCARADAP